MAAIEFDRLVSYFDADLTPLQKGVAAGIKLVDKLENRFKNFKGNIGGGKGLGIQKEIDAELRGAQADLRRFEMERSRMERQYTQTVEREGRQRVSARNREQKRAANDMLATMRRVNLEERKAGAGRSFGSLGGLSSLSGLGGMLGGAALGTTLLAFAKNSNDAYTSLDRLVRFVATLDSSFQSPQMIKQLRLDILQLSEEVPQEADAIARAAFSVKSAYSQMSEPELIKFLREMSVQATASNTTVDQHADHVIALAKMYGFTADQLKEFGAIMTTTFGAALSTDQDVAQGFNQLIVPAKNAGQGINELAAAMGAVQAASTDAETATNGLKNVFFKMLDPKFKKSMKEQFNVELFDQGKWRGLNAIVNDVAKSLEGLNDEQRTLKVASVFTDRREATGFLSLIANIKQYNDLLQQGGDTEAFERKTKVMIESADAKWQKLANRVNEYKTNLGAAISDTAFGNLGDAANEFAASQVPLMIIDSMIKAEKQAGDGGLKTGEAFGRGVMLGIDGQQDAVATASQQIVQQPAAQAQASSSGSSLGISFAAGIANGIRAGGGAVGGAVASIIDWAFKRGKAEQDSQSPSRRAAEELGIPFVQGIEAGMQARSSMLQTVAGGVVGGMFGPKTKQKLKENLKQLFDDLQYEAGRIDTGAGHQKQASERAFDAILADQSASYEAQMQIYNYYQEIYDIEEAAYQKRLANIAQREANIRDRKDLKPQEKTNLLRALGDERTDATANREHGRFESGKAKDSAFTEAGMRRIEAASRELARSIMTDENAIIGIKQTAETAAQADYDHELQRIDGRINAYESERDNYAVGSREYIEWNNKVIDAQEDRKDAVVKGTGEIKKARLDDKQSMRDLLSAIADFTQQSTSMEMDAAEAKLELLKATGASEATVFAAEMALSIERENFKHRQQEDEIRRRAQSLHDEDIKGTQLLQIDQQMNAQLEAEAQRHNAAMEQITVGQGDKSILGQWRKIAQQLPTWRAQLKEFGVGLPEAIGGVWSQAMQGMDGTWKGFLSSLKQAFFQTVQEMLSELFRTQLIKGLIGLAGSLFGGLGSGGTGASSGALGHLSVGAHAEGGIPAMGRLSLVGERGPELFVPNVGGRILSHEDSMQAVSGRGGHTTINNSVTQVFRTPRSLTAPKSTRQQAEAAAVGLANGSRKVR